IEAEVRKQLAQKRFTEVAEQFSNGVYEQSDSLQPVADKLKLNVLNATVQRKPAPGATGPLASPKLLEAVFSDDSLRNKRNTEAVEAAPNQLVAARVVQHNPAHLLPLAQVKDTVKTQLVRQLATAQAVKAGTARVAELQKAGAADAAGLEAPVLVSRALPRDLTRKVLEGILSADASKLPAVVGVDAGDGSFVLARINKVVARDPAVVDAKRAATQYAQAWSAVEAQAYSNALKTRYKAVVKSPAAAASSSAP
ncbi:MAG: peptidyl-prolyl cis-trans isomerase, partial [Paucibacter sp.]|nr:peptidyl-prolyl cis-trans isomerase [Roseateles sp.]